MENITQNDLIEFSRSVFCANEKPTRKFICIQIRFKKHPFLKIGINYEKPKFWFVKSLINFISFNKIVFWGTYTFK